MLINRIKTIITQRDTDGKYEFIFIDIIYRFLPLACFMNFERAALLGDDDPCPVQSKEWNVPQSASAQDLLQKCIVLYYQIMRKIIKCTTKKEI